MARFLVLYNSAEPAASVMAGTPPEKMKENMQEWLNWRDEVTKVMKVVDFGYPLQAVGQVIPDGVANSTNPAAGYTMVEGDSKDALLEVLKSHPHLKVPGGSIDVLEMLPIPGMEV